jgi:hypothetical protein
MDWIQLIVMMIGILGTILGVVIPLHLHTLATLKAIQDEMKDFHGRLERQDAEFKAGILLIEEKFKLKT